jgi:hypothetical protein
MELISENHYNHRQLDPLLRHPHESRNPEPKTVERIFESEVCSELLIQPPQWVYGVIPVY